MYLIDTNIFLEILLRQKKSEECKTFLRKIKDNNRFYVSSFSIHSIEVIMIRKNRLGALTDFLEFLSGCGINRIDTSTQDEIKILELIKSQGLDFDDSVQLYICQKHNFKIVSYDKHFDSTPVERTEPGEIEI